MSTLLCYVYHGRDWWWSNEPGGEKGTPYYISRLAATVLKSTVKQIREFRICNVSVEWRKSW